MVLRKFGSPGALLSLMIALTLACALSSAVNAGDSGNSPKSSADSPDSAGLVDCYLEIEKTKLHLVQGGTGQQTVVMLHGNAGDIQDFEYGLAKLISKNYRVIGFDRPGHGKSGRPGSKAASVEYQALMLHKTLQSLGVNKAILLGHSWGASLALCYALKYPAETEGLVLLAPAAFPGADSNPLLQAMIKTPLIGELTLMIGNALMGDERLRHKLKRAFYPQPVPENYLRMATSNWLGRKRLRAYLEDEWSLNASLRGMSKHYGELRMPVVIVTGDWDQIVSPKKNAYRLKKRIPQAQLVELKGAGHEIQLTSPDCVYSALKLISTATTNLSPRLTSAARRTRARHAHEARRKVSIRASLRQRGERGIFTAQSGLPMFQSAPHFGSEANSASIPGVILSTAFQSAPHFGSEANALEMLLTISPVGFNPRLTSAARRTGKMLKF